LGAVSISPTEDQPESRAASGPFRDVTEGIWELREAGPSDAQRTVLLLLAGALASARCYDALVGHATLTAGSVRLVAATLPGFGRTRAPDDVTVEHYGRLAADLAASLGAEVVAGHSLGANVALEMALRGGWAGPFVLLSPSFCRKDESIFPRALDRLGSVLGHLPFSLMFRIIGPAMRGSLPPDQADDVVAELANNDPRFVRRQTRAYLQYLDGHPALAGDLATSGRSTTVIFGEKDDVKIQPEERAALEGSPSASLVIISGAGHFALIEKPGRVAELIVEALGSD
jgi:pimeloyl-ACP methyl ester carboxylesterase